MPSPFPGMDPSWEHPRSWPTFRHRLITAIAIYLGPQLRPKYRVVVEAAMYQTATPDSLLVGIPDVVLKAVERDRIERSSGLSTFKVWASVGWVEVTKPNDDNGSVGVR